MPRSVTIRSLPQAFEVIEQMRVEGYDWGEDYRPAPSEDTSRRSGGSRIFPAGRQTTAIRVT